MIPATRCIPVISVACLAMLLLTLPVSAQRATAPQRGDTADRATDQRAEAERPRREAVRQRVAAKQSPGQNALEKTAESIIEEARKSWKEDEKWPREKSNFADDHPADIPDRVLLDALARKHHDDPRLDAYVRWQLLSYEPDIDQLSGPQIKRLLDAMPPYASRPEPNVQAFNQATARYRGQSSSRRSTGSGGTSITMGGTSMGDVSFNTGNVRVQREQAFITGFGGAGGGLQPQIDTVRSGTFLQVQGSISADGRYVNLNVRTLNQQLVELRRETIQTGMPGVAFADGLVDLLPAAGGLQLAGQMMDLKRRIEAGCESVEQAKENLLERATEHADNREITTRQRRELLELLKDVNRAHRTTAERIEREGDLRFRGKEKVIRLCEDDYIDLYWALRGQPRKRD